MLITCGSSDDVLARLVVTGLNLERCVAVREYERGAGGPRDDEDEHPHRSSDSRQLPAVHTEGSTVRPSVCHTHCRCPCRHRRWLRLGDRMTRGPRRRRASSFRSVLLLPIVRLRGAGIRELPLPPSRVRPAPHAQHVARSLAGHALAWPPQNLVAHPPERALRGRSSTATCL
jgi:hypothetical protein